MNAEDIKVLFEIFKYFDYHGKMKLYAIPYDVKNRFLLVLLLLLVFPFQQSYGLDSCEDLKAQFPNLRFEKWQIDCALVDRNKDDEIQMNVLRPKLKSKKALNILQFESFENFKIYEDEYEKSFGRSIAVPKVSQTNLTIGNKPYYTVKDELQKIINREVGNLIISEWALQNKIIHSPGNTAPVPLMISDGKFREKLNKHREVAQQILQYLQEKYPVEFNCYVWNHRMSPVFSPSVNVTEPYDLAKIKDIDVLRDYIEVTGIHDETMDKAKKETRDTLDHFGITQDQKVACDEKTKPVQKPAPLPSVEECFNRKLGSSLSRALQNDIKPIAKGIHVSTV